MDECDEVIFLQETGFDFLSGMASLFTLTSISLKRLFAMGGPLHHRITSLLTYAVFIAIPCILALIVSGIFALVGHVQLLPHLFMFHVVLAPCSFPSAVTTVAYITFWFKVRTSQATGREREAENRAGDSRSDLLSPVIFSFTWLPYPIVLSMMNLCLKCVFF